MEFEKIVKLESKKIAYSNKLPKEKVIYKNNCQNRYLWGLQCLIRLI